MKKVFLDFGSCAGKAIAKFKAEHNDWREWEIHAFEPNPHIQAGYGENVVVHKLAIWDADCVMPFYFNAKKPTDGGASLIKWKHTGNLDIKHPVNVQCIDIAKWIRDRYTSNDYLIIKIDIEGAEYQVLPHLIKTGVINMIKVLYAGTHSLKVDVTENETVNLLNQIREIGVEVYEDYIASNNALKGKPRWKPT